MEHCQQKEKEGNFALIKNSLASNAPISRIARQLNLILQSGSKHEGEQERIFFHLSLCCIDLQRKDVLCHLLANHYDVIKDILSDVLMYGSLSRCYGVIKVLLEAGTCPYSLADLDDMCELAPHNADYIVTAYSDMLDKHQKCLIGEGKKKISVWQVALLNDDVKLLQLIETSFGLNNVISSGSSTHWPFISTSKCNSILPIHDACLFSATSCLRYLLKSQKYNFLEDSSSSIESKKKKLTSLFCLTCTDTKKLQLLFEYNIFNNHLEDDVNDFKEGIPKSEHEKHVLASFLHHLASAGSFAFLQHTMLNVSGHTTRVFNRCIGPSTPDVVEFLLQKGIDKNSTATYVRCPSHIRPMTLLCSQVKAPFAISRNGQASLEVDEHLKVIFKTMELLTFEPSSLGEKEVNPLAFLVSETVSTVDALETSIYTSEMEVDMVRKRLLESLYISKEIFSWLLKKGFKFQDRILVKGRIIDCNANIFDNLLDLLERTEFLILSCCATDQKDNGLEGIINEVLHQYQVYFIDLLRLYHSHGGKLHPNEAFYEFIYHNNRPCLDPLNHCMEITLNQCSNKEYYQLLHQLIEHRQLHPKGQEELNVEYLEEKSRSPRKLTDLCRQEIFSNVDTSIPCAFQLLPLPPYLKNYICDLL